MKQVFSLNRFQKISDLLDEQLKIHNKLLEIETKKTEILTKGDIKALDELVTTQQPYIMRANNIEKQREKLQNEMGLGDLSLREVIERHPEADILNRNYSELSDVLSNLKKVCERNQKILGARLDVINSILLNTGAVNSKEVTYTKGK
jgi:flagellar biosynthesis/type III secretory pathway chaperone